MKVHNSGKQPGSTETSPAGGFSGLAKNYTMSPNSAKPGGGLN